MKRLLICTMLLSFYACSGAETDPSTSDGTVSIPEAFGKSDNYIATSAQEYILSGTSKAELPADYVDLATDQQAEALEAAVTRKTSTLTRAAQRHIEEVVKEANASRLAENPLPEPDPDDPDAAEPEDPFQDYFIYVKSEQRSGTVTETIVDATEVVFDFEFELVGALELIQLVGGNSQSFDLDLDTADPDSEVVQVGIEASPSTDSFLRYDVMFEDGIYDIALVFGGDYNDERYDLETAKWTVEFLLEEGWQHPDVTTFEELKHDSPPFTMELSVEGRDIEARVYIVHAQMDDDAGQEQSLLRDLTVQHIKTRDVVIYSGHAGSNAGMILDYHPRYELGDDEFAELEMRDEYQVFVFDGCNSYRTYVDAMMANPVRTWENTDLVTTVNTTPFSAGYEIINRFVHWLTFSDAEGGHIPVSWNALLRGVNDTYLDVHYGVHGIDQSPKLNPHGGGDAMCQACDTSADCGAGANYCLNYSDGGACGVACTDAAACGDGFDCISVYDDPDLFYLPKQCVRQTMTCG